MKVKNAFIIFAILYVLVAVICAFVELDNVVSTCSDIRSTVAVAADMALQQATASDEMFNSIQDKSQVGVNDVDDITRIGVALNGVSDYTYKNIFELTYGGSINTLDAKENLFKKMYFNPDNCLFAKDDGFLNDLCKISTSINGMDIPNIAQLGLLYGGTDVSSDMKSELQKNVGVSKYLQSLTKNGFGSEDWLELKSIKKEYVLGNGKTDYYFLAPTNVGVTYVDPKILQNAFVCNMDLLMRGDLIYDSAETPEGRQGLRERDGISNVYGGTAVGSDESLKGLIATNNIIHSQNMVFIKGQYNNVGGFSINEYARPKVEYKVINICDDRNKDLVKLALGITGTNYDTWLSEMDLTASDEKYICVAKVTIYADVLISYETLMGRQINAMYSRYLGADAAEGDKAVVDYNEQGANMAKLQCIPYTNDINDKNADGKVSDVSGNRMYEYTTYYAIM